MGFKIGIDVGGTFTDFLLTRNDGAGRVFKVLSTPDDPAIAVLDGLGRMADDQELALTDFLAQVDLIVHGTTVTTNAVITGNVAKTGLLTTEGFRDALEMRRGVREVLYDNKYTAPEPIVPRRLRLPVPERVDLNGRELIPIDETALSSAVDELAAQNVEAVAICFMHGYADPRHEQLAAKAVRDLLPQAYLSVSTEVLPQVRFYERTSTTVLNAAVGPILGRYLDSLTRRLDESGFGGILLIMQSNGGVAPPEAVKRLAASTLLSGPAAAPAAGLAHAEIHGQSRFISIDMGGTSFDAALVYDGVPTITTHGQVNRFALALPSMEISTIGAGGGSIAWIDDGGLLRMGPQSAGAKPGPACYGLGGTKPTCSDANLVLGYLDPTFFAGGAIALDLAAAKTAIYDQIAQPLGLSEIEAAAGMYRIMNTNMASAMREISVQKGYDPREFLLVCAGGAGPIHAAGMARELEMRRILIPKESSIFCAAGMLRSDLKHDYVRSFSNPFIAGELDETRFVALVDEMMSLGAAALDREHMAQDARRFSCALDLRYLGQYHEVAVIVPIEAVNPVDYGQISTAFHAEHNRLYGYDLSQEDTGIELVNIRITAIGITDKPPLAEEPRRPAVPDETAIKGAREMLLIDEAAFEEVPVYDGHALGHGNRVSGPCIIEQINTTIVVPPKFDVWCDTVGNFVMEDQS